MSKNRRRILVALLPRGDLLEQIRGLSSVFEPPRRERIPPHVTVVPPLNLSAADLEEALILVRRVASGTSRFHLGFEGLASFTPSANTVHLAIADDSGELSRLRDLLRVGPLERDDQRTFVPHITLVKSASPEQIEASRLISDARESCELGPLGVWDVDRVYVLEQAAGESGTFWQVLSEEAFGSPVVVGRGGIELKLRTMVSLESAAAALLEREGVRMDPAAYSEGDLVCVSAEFSDDPGKPVGVVIGRVSGQGAWLDCLVVAREHRRLGVARQVLAHWCYQAASRDAILAIHRMDGEKTCLTTIGAEVSSSAPDFATVLGSLGFSPIGDLLLRQLQ
ncbi:MAG TPA: GNAT family N-acetyltransferase [Microthrixaceae bacterium]|nr:GNAT family N-acetyltransferase [Microthrixaceae bacterium]